MNCLSSQALALILELRDPCKNSFLGVMIIMSHEMTYHVVILKTIMNFSHGESELDATVLES